MADDKGGGFSWGWGIGLGAVAAVVAFPFFGGAIGAAIAGIATLIIAGVGAPMLFGDKKEEVKAQSTEAPKPIQTPVDETKKTAEPPPGLAPDKTLVNTGKRLEEKELIINHLKEDMSKFRHYPGDKAIEDFVNNTLKVQDGEQVVLLQGDNRDHFIIVKGKADESTKLFTATNVAMFDAAKGDKGEFGDLKSVTNVNFKIDHALSAEEQKDFIAKLKTVSGDPTLSSKPLSDPSFTDLSYLPQQLGLPKKGSAPGVNASIV